jgi:hypothetical protein
MSPRKSSAPEDPPELPLPCELDRELELDELLCELELDDREPLLKDCPPPGRASKKVIRGVEEVWPNALAGVGPAIDRATAKAPAKNVDAGRRSEILMPLARRGAR